MNRCLLDLSLVYRSLNTSSERYAFQKNFFLNRYVQFSLISIHISITLQQSKTFLCSIYIFRSLSFYLRQNLSLRSIDIRISRFLTQFFLFFRVEHCSLSSFLKRKEYIKHRHNSTQHCVRIQAFPLVLDCRVISHHIV